MVVVAVIVVGVVVEIVAFCESESDDFKGKADT
jgi:hypothetical protein